MPLLQNQQICSGWEECAFHSSQGLVIPEKQGLVGVKASFLNLGIVDI